MRFSIEEILETINMVSKENLDIRAVTMGINLQDCASPYPEELCTNIREKIYSVAKNLVPEAEKLERKYGIPIVNKRISLTPISTVIAPAVRGLEKEHAIDIAVKVAKTLDSIGADLKFDLIGGYSAMVQRNISYSDEVLIESLPRALSETKRVCSSINVGTTISGINLDAINLIAKKLKETAEATKIQKGFGCAKFVVLCNAPEDIPFVAGAFHGYSGGESTINIGISGPGVVKTAVQSLKQGATVVEVAECIKRTTFKITRAGELIGKEIAKNLNTSMGAVDLSLAPTPKTTDSVAEILEEIGLEQTGAHGSTAVLYLLTNAVKTGGAMATSRVGGYSGAFIPVSEDTKMNEAVKCGALSIDKLEAMTAVCSLGLDMIAIPGDTEWEVIAAIMADEMAIGVMNNKCTGVRLIPVPEGKEGQDVDFGGLFGKATIIRLNKKSPAKFVRRGGRIPAPLHSIRN
ncbi:PFL family protein [Candidatus Micrarchaeota archaeon]|nr:PFL family protein [Candidatus Micrarchaeota archaeon]